MSWDSWGPAVLTSGALTICGLAGGYFLKAAIEKGLQHGFDRQIENVKSDLRSKEEEINSLKKGALAVMASHHEQLDKRRIVAAEKLWESVLSQRKYYMLTSYMQSIKIREIDKRLQAKDEDAHKIQQLLDFIWRTSGAESFKGEEGPDVERERLFVPPRAWMAFEAIRSVTTGAYVIMAALRTGAGLQLVRDSSSTIDLIKKLLPHQSENLDRYPDFMPYMLLKELEEFVFLELSSEFSSSEGYKRAVEDASLILKHVTGRSAAKIPNSVPKDVIRSDADSEQTK